MDNEKNVYFGEALIDLTNDSVTPETLLEGETAHDKSGAQITGTYRSTPVDAYTKEETNALLEGFYTKEETYTKQETNTLLEDYVTKNEVYTKEEVDDLVDIDLTNYYTKEETETLINNAIGVALAGDY